MRRALAGAVLAVLALAGCSSGDGAITTTANNPDAGYVSGDGTSRQFPVEERGDPVDFTTRTVDGIEVSAADYRGRVLVLNFWYASCPPCRSEAPILAAASEKYAHLPVAFLGVNVRDDAATAASFEKRFGIGYPSALDADTGDVQLAVAGATSANATPTTLILDVEGRVAARIVGEIDSAALLEGFIDAELEGVG